MKTPKARKLPSGSWFVRVRIDGEDIGITRRTEKEAIAEAMAIKAGLRSTVKREKCDLTLRQMIDRYIGKREPTLSPATIRGYTIIRDNRLQRIMDIPVKKLSDDDFQLAFNADLLTGKFSAKTMTNTWGFIKTVLKKEGKREVEISLPEVVNKPHEFLQPDQISIFLDAIKGNRHEIPALLALHSLRASEILDLRWEDIDTEKGLIYVRGSAVPDKDNILVHKETNKNKTSRRIVPIMIDQLREAIDAADKSSAYICLVASGAIYNAINRTCKKNNLPEVGIHGLRHSFASLAYHLGLPEEMTMKIGGWADRGTMRKIYTHLADQDIAKHTEALTSFFNKSPTE